MAKRKPAPQFTVPVGQTDAKRTAPKGYKIMTVKLPDDVHAAWNLHRAKHPGEDDFQAFCIRMARKHIGMDE